MIPENEVAWHVGTSTVDPASGRFYTVRGRELIGDQVADNRSANWHMIGIGMNHRTWTEFTPETLNSAVALCADICRRNNMKANRISNHWEMVGWKNCPAFWMNHPAQFEEFKRRVAAAI